MYACTASPAEASDSAAVTLRIRILLPPSLSIAGVDESASTSGFLELAMELPREKIVRGLD